jgi:hypothetical protein
MSGEIRIFPEREGSATLQLWPEGNRIADRIVGSWWAEMTGVGHESE